MYWARNTDIKFQVDKKMNLLKRIKSDKNLEFINGMKNTSKMYFSSLSTAHI